MAWDKDLIAKELQYVLAKYKSSSNSIPMNLYLKAKEWDSLGGACGYLVLLAMISDCEHGTNMHDYIYKYHSSKFGNGQTYTIKDIMKFKNVDDFTLAKYLVEQ